MTETQAKMAYLAKAGEKALPATSAVFVKGAGTRMAQVKDASGRRLALVIDTKKGFTIDLVKKLH